MTQVWREAHHTLVSTSLCLKIFHNKKVGLFLMTPGENTAFSNLGNKNHIHNVKSLLPFGESTLLLKTLTSKIYLCFDL